MILYIGNKLSIHGFTPTTIDTLGPKLQEDFSVILISDKKNKVLRFWDAIQTIIKFRGKLSAILIDTYSTSNFYYTLVSALLAKRFGIPYVPILHGGGLPNRLKQTPRLSRQVFSNAYVNASPSHYLEKEFRDSGYEVKYIPNYIETKNYPGFKRTTLRPRLLYVRSFHKIYNPTMAVKVLFELSKDYKDVELCMVGPDKDGSLEDTLNLARELKVDSRLKITGKLSKEEWIAISKDYDIFINTTNFDNLPVSVIEAMCLGFPIVSTNPGGLSYLIEHETDGMLLDPDDVGAMAGHIRKLLDDPSLAEKLSKNAISKAHTYDWSEIRKKWGELLHEIKGVS
ncbi:glycosyltransferase family 4 protein [Fulvivirgaceae bacterium BMA10]|uniref:Glycosyltransferase family 4 protein n=1 Tax=Splendidivirga corallicola TaxID=3051826 RepID=A0ABT8L174_9BACT|nr:glycosyltransferase family 4 protein [Fulvivirgaceae bacterium BMA10]